VTPARLARHFGAFGKKLQRFILYLGPPLALVSIIKDTPSPEQLVLLPKIHLPIFIHITDSSGCISNNCIFLPPVSDMHHDSVYFGYNSMTPETPDNPIIL